MKLTLEQFETQFADNNLSVTDWFDTTYGLFKELEALDRSRREWYQNGYAEAEYECKAKDEKLKQLDDAYSKVASDFESAVMEIERLKAELNSAFIRDLKSIKISSNGKHATWEILKDTK